MKFKQVNAMPDLTFSAVGFGCWGISGGDVWNGTTDENSVAAVQHAVDSGINFFDVAPVYGLGHAETVLGRALQGRRHEVIIATKCGLVWDEQKSVTVNLTADSLFKEIDESLARLQTDYVDIYQIHWPNPNMPIAETMSALKQIQASGKVKYVGVSNFSLGLTQEAMLTGEVASHQGLYNLLERNPDSYHSIPLTYRVADEILPYCTANGMAFFPYSPLFQGLLTDDFQAQGTFDDKDVRAANPKLVGEQLDIYFEISEQLRAFARNIGKPLSQIALNWLINQTAVTSVICGAQTVAHVAENVGAVSWELTADMEAEIERILRPFSATLT